MGETTKIQWAHYSGPRTHHTLNHLADPKGGDIDEWPEELRVRELPEVRR